MTEPSGYYDLEFVCIRSGATYVKANISQQHERRGIVCPRCKNVISCVPEVDLMWHNWKLIPLDIHGNRIEGKFNYRLLLKVILAIVILLVIALLTWWANK